MIKKKHMMDLAAFGGKPEFNKPLSVGQFNSPDKEIFRAAFDDIFDRKYYTNHGKLAQQFESELEDYLGVKHAISITNGTLALIIAAKALGIKGKVITPSFTSVATYQSLYWADIEIVFCDVDPLTHMITPELVEPLIDDEVVAILAVQLWGEVCDIDGLQALAHKHNLTLYFDSCHAFGSSHENKFIGNFGALEVFSFHETKILNTVEGGAICTNDDKIAGIIRNIRSSYGAGHFVDVPFTGNGRFSEAQAAFGLMSFKNLKENISRNKKHHLLYEKYLSGINGLKLIKANLGNGNFQYIIIEIHKDQFGLSKEQLRKILHEENILVQRHFYPEAHKIVFFNPLIKEKTSHYPVTEMLNNSIIQLPSGSNVDEDKIERICEVIKFLHDNANHIEKELSI